MEHSSDKIIVHGGETLVVLTITGLFLLGSFVYSVHHAGAPITEDTIQASSTIPVQTARIVRDSENPFLPLTLSAKAVYVYDVTNDQILFQKNPDTVLPLASLTKVMTAAIVSSLLPANSMVTIDKNFVDAADSDPQLVANQQWNLKDLLDYTLTISSNNGAVSLAAAVGTSLNQTNQSNTLNGSATNATSPDISNISDATTSRATFIRAMNTEAQNIGLTNTTFYNESGLDQDKTHSGAYGSARDMATLFAHTLETNPEVLEATRYPKFIVTSTDNSPHIAVNTDSVLSKIPSIIASKTGYTDLAGGNLIVAYDADLGHPVIVVVLGSTYDGRFADMLSLVRATNEYLSLQNKEPAV